jgi:hypothetical protein
MESFVSNENKSVLWGVLQDNKTFQNIENAEYEKIKIIFEETILKQSNNFNGSLMDLNKETISELSKNINNFKNKPKISMIYKAEDLKNERENEINIRFKQQQEDMNTMLNPSKPSDVKFSEDLVDKPIGNDLDRSIAEMMASRERELEQLPIDKQAAEKWINNGNSTNQQSTNGNNTKNVSFNDTNEEFILESVSNEDTSNFNDNDSNASVNNLDTLDIFSKLKKKSNSGDKYQKEDEVSNSTLFKEILEIKQSISELKNLIISK